MNRVQRIVSLIVFGSVAVPAASQVEIRLDPANGNAELVSGKAEDIAKGVMFSTRLPDGTVEEGVWDINPLAARGPLVGIRVLNMQSFVQTQDPKSYVVIKLKSRWDNAGYPPSHASLVPSQFITISDAPLELSWCMYNNDAVDIGTCVADEKPGSIQAFTQTKDGSIRTGLWEENVSGKPATRIVTPWPFGIERMIDGSYEFIIGSKNRKPSHGSFSPDYKVFHRNTDILPVAGVPDDNGANRGPQTFDLDILLDGSAAVNAPAVTATRLLDLQQEVIDVELRMEEIFASNNAVIPIFVTFDILDDDVGAQAGVDTFLAFLPDVRVGLNDQAFVDSEDDDDDLYDIIPFQAGADFIRYVGQEGFVVPPRTTRYIDVPIALKDQVVWFVNLPLVMPTQTITFNSELIDGLHPWMFDIREHGFGNGTGNRFFKQFAIFFEHELSHILGFDCRGTALTDLSGDGVLEDCTQLDLGDSGFDVCENYISLLDVFRFNQSDLETNPFANDTAGREATRYFQLNGEHVVLTRIDGTSANLGAVQMTSATGLTMPGDSTTPQPSHLRAFDLQDQQSPMGSSIGIMGPFPNRESIRPYGNPPSTGGAYGHTRRLSRMDFKVLDALGWNINPEIIIPMLDVSRPNVTLPLSNSVVEPDFDYEVASFTGPVRQIQIYTEPDAFNHQLVGTANVFQSGMGFNGIPLQRGDTYHMYYISEDFFAGAVESEGVTIKIRCIADQNSDGMVTPADFGSWVSNFNAMDPRADANEDGMVSPADFGAWVSAFNAGC